jgi:hypothetical protein
MPRNKSKRAAKKSKTTSSASSKKANKKRSKSAAKPRKSTAKSRAPKKSAKKKTGRRSISSRPSVAKKKRSRLASELERERELRDKGFERAAARSSRQSGDLQGLFREEEADSESVDELVEEGNAFEAGAVAGVEEADDSDEREVHAHEVPEDDVPEEYLDRD